MNPCEYYDGLDSDLAAAGGEILRLEAELAEARGKIKDEQEMRWHEERQHKKTLAELEKAEAQLSLAQQEIAELKGDAEPVAWMFHHAETGRTMCVEAQQVEWGFEKNNPRLQKICPLYTTPPTATALVEDFKRRAIEVCMKYDDRGIYGAQAMASDIESLPLIEGEKE